MNLLGINTKDGMLHDGLENVVYLFIYLFKHKADSYTELFQIIFSVRTYQEY